MDKEKNTKAVSEENIYCLNGRVPVKKAIPFGLQHVLAMFVSNLAPVLIVCSAAFVRGSENHLSAAEITQLCSARDVCSGDRDLSAALPGMEDWLQASDRYGSQFYLSW
mgnify:CR=1 FL=1